jgi:hypothetical protein
MSQDYRNSIVEDEELIEVPYPPLIGHRKKFDAFELDLTGGRHSGHLPVYVIEIEGWVFRRCRCGFSLALTPSGAIWWLRTTKDAMEIKNFKTLLRALNSNCWAHPRLGPPKNAVISPPAVAQIATEPAQLPLKKVQSVSHHHQPYRRCNANQTSKAVQRRWWRSRHRSSGGAPMYPTMSRGQRGRGQIHLVADIIHKSGSKKICCSATCCWR